MYVRTSSVNTTHYRYLVKGKQNKEKESLHPGVVCGNVRSGFIAPPRPESRANFV